MTDDELNQLAIAVKTPATRDRAFAAIVGELSPAIKAICCKLVGKADVDDCCQTVWIALFQLCERYDPSRGPFSHLATCAARRRACDFRSFQRAKKRQSHLQHQSIQDDDGDINFIVKERDTVADDDARDWLIDQLALTGVQRQVIEEVLKYEHPKNPLAAIAESIGSNVKGVDNAIRGIRRKGHEFLQARGLTAETIFKGTPSKNAEHKRMSILQPTTDAATNAANQIRNIIRQQFVQLQRAGSQGFNVLWNNPQASVQSIIAALGTDAQTVFELASLNVSIVASAAAIGGVAAPSLPQIPPQWSISFNPDGSATLTAIGSSSSSSSSSSASSSSSSGD